MLLLKCVLEVFIINNKKLLIIALLICIFLFAVSTVSANDTNDTQIISSEITTNDTIVDQPTASNIQINEENNDNSQISEKENKKVEKTIKSSSSEKLGATNDENKLGATATTITISLSKTSIAIGNTVSVTPTVKYGSTTVSKGDVYYYINGIDGTKYKIKESSDKSYSFTPALPGTYTIYGWYEGYSKNGYSECTSNTVTLTVTGSGNAYTAAVKDYSASGSTTTISITPSKTSVTAGTTITLTPTVKQGSSAAQKEKVHYFVNGVYLDKESSDNSFSFTPTEDGTYTIVGVYEGKSKDSIKGSVSDPITITVGNSKSATTTEVALSSLSTTYNSQITLSSTVKSGSTTLNSASYGTVSYYYGSGTLINTVNVGATCTFTPTSVTTYDIYAIYNGNSNYQSSQSGTKSLTVSKASTTTTVTLSSSSTSYGNSITVSSSVTSGATGTVYYYYKLSTASSYSLIGSASVGNTVTFTPSTVGTYTIYARYGGNTYYSESTSATKSLTVTKSTPIFSITLSNNNINLGNSITITPSISATTGTINYVGQDSNGNNINIGSSGVSGSVTYTPTAAGEYTIWATYNSNDYYNSATAGQKTLTVTDGRTATNTIFVDSYYYFDEGGSTNVIAKVKSGNVEITQGTVTYYWENNTVIGTVTAGQGISVSHNKYGQYKIYAVYSGNTIYAPSTSSLCTIYVKVIPDVQITASKNNVLVGENVNLTFSAKVNGEELNQGFFFIAYDDWKFYDEIRDTRSYLISFDTPGTYVIGGGYDSGAVASIYENAWSEDAVTINVRNPTTTELTLNTSDITQGNSKTITSTVKFNGNTLTSSDGNVSYYYGNGNLIGTANIGSSVTFTPTTTGTYNIYAVYNGNSVYNSSKSSSKSFKVTQSTTLTLTLSDSQITLGDTVTVYSVVKSGTVDVTQGTVEYYVNGADYDSLDVSEGHITFTPTSAGTYALSAYYYDDFDDYADSQSNELTLIVKNPTSITVNLSDTSINLGESITISSTVTTGGYPVTGTVSYYANNSLIDTVNVGDSVTYTPTAAGKYNIYAVYNGNDNYAKATSANKTLNVDEKPEIILATLNNRLNETTITVGDSLLFYADVHPSKSGDRVNLYVDGVDTGVTLPANSNGGTYFNVVGDHNVTVLYNGYQSNRVLVHVEKADPIINSYAGSYSINIGNSVNIYDRVTASKSFSILGNVTYAVDDVNITTLQTGTSFNYKPSSLGQHKITVTYRGNDYYNSISKEFNIQVTKAPSSININSTTVNYGDTVSLTAQTVNSTGDVIVKLYYSNKTEVENPNITVSGNTITITNLNAGQYTINVTTNVDENHTSSSKTASLTVNKIKSGIGFDTALHHYWNENVTITVRTTNADGIKDVKLLDSDNNPLSEDYYSINGYVVTIKGLPVGSYKLEAATVPKNDNYDSTKSMKTFTVEAIPSNIELNDIEYVYDETGSTTYTLTGATGITNAIIIKDGVKIADADINGNQITVSNLQIGEYTLNVTTMPDENHTEITKSIKVNVTKALSKFDIGDKSVSYYSSPVIPVNNIVGITGFTFELFDNSSNKVSAGISYDGRNIIVNQGLNVGNYTLNVTSTPDENHTSVTKSVKLEIYKYTPTIPSYNFEGNWGEEIEISFLAVNMGDGLNFVVLDSNNNSVGKIKRLSSFSVAVYDIAAGNYKINISTMPSNKVNLVYSYSNLTVKPIQSDLSMDNIEFDYGGTGETTVTLTGATGITNAIIIKDGVKIADADINGNQITVSDLPFGEYTLNVTTIPDENHTAITKSGNIKVNKKTPTLTITANNATYASDTIITFTTDTAGEYDAAIAGEKYTLSFNEGETSKTINVKLAAKDNYTASFSYNETNNYKNTSTSTTFKVNKLTIHLGGYDTDKEYNGYARSQWTIGNFPNINYTYEFHDSNDNDVSEYIYVNNYDAANKKLVFKFKEGLAIGVYTLNITIGNENYTTVSKIIKYEITPSKSTIYTLNDINYEYGNNGSTRLGFNGATGVNINILKNNEIVNAEISIKDNKIYVSNLTVGEYTLNVTTIPDGNHTEVSRTVNIIVTPAKSDITIPNIITIYGEKATINVTYTGSTGFTNVTIIKDGIKINPIINLSGKNITVSDLEIGEYTLNITTIPDENHTAITKSGLIKVNPAESKITIKPITNVNYNSTVTINFNVNNRTTVTYTLKTKNGTVIIENAEVTSDEITLNNIGAGNYTIIINNGKQGNYNGNISSAEFTIYPAGSSVSAGPVSVVYGDDIVVEVTSVNATGVVYSVVNSSGVVVASGDVDDGVISGLDLAVGSYVVRLTTVVDGNHSVGTGESSIEVDRANSNLTIGITSSVYPNNITITVKSKVDGTYTVQINDTTSYTVEVKNGEGNISIKKPAGIYNATINLEESDNYTASTISEVFEVSEGTIDFNVTVSDVNYPDGGIVSINSSIDGDYIVNVDGKDYHVSIVDGTGNVTLDILAPGKYPVIIAPNISNYNKNPVNDEINISNGTFDFNIAVNNVNYPDNVEIIINSTVDGNFTVKIGDENYNVEVTNGTGKLIIGNLTSGNYTVEVTSNIPNYDNKNIKDEFKVNNGNLEFNVTVENVTYPDSPVIIINSNADGEYIVTLNDDNYIINVKNGKGSLTISNLTAGDYTALITSNIDNYDVIHDSVDFTVVKFKPQLNISSDVNVIPFNGNVILNSSSSNPNTKGNVTYHFDNGENITVPVGVTVSYTPDSAGNHTVIVSYDDPNFEDETHEILIQVNAIDAEFNVNVDKTNVNYGGSISLNTSAGNIMTNGNVTYRFDDGTSLIIANIGEEIKYTPKTTGEHTVKVEYSGDNNYLPKEVEVKINVDKLNSNIKINATEKPKVNDEVIVHVDLPDDATGTVTYTNGNNTITLPVGQNYKFKPDAAGQYNISATYNGNAKYNPDKANIIVNVDKTESNIKVNSSNIEVGNNITVNVSLPKDAKGNLEVTIGNNTYNVPVNGENTELNIPDVPVGEHDVIINYSGDDKYKPQSVTDKIKVSPINTNNSDIQIEDLGNGTISVKVPKDLTGNITVEIDGEKYSSEIINGEAIINMDNKTPGKHNINVKYPGDENHTGASVKGSVIIPKLNPVINADLIMDNGKLTVDINMDSNVTGDVEVEIDGKTYNVSLVNGKAQLTLNNLSSGNSSINIKYLGDKNYNPNTLTKSVNIPLKSLRIEVVSNFTRVANDYYVAGERGAMFYAVLKDNYGNVVPNKIVQITVNGVVYEVTSDTEGRVGLQINLVCANIYTYALFFQGDDEYHASALASSKLTVIKKSTSIKASNTVFKVSKKTKTIKVKLNTIKNPYDGKVYLGHKKVIKLTINGKTYTAKTNKNGVAKFKVVLNKKGKYTAKIKFAGTKTYEKCSKKIKVTVK